MVAFGRGSGNLAEGKVCLEDGLHLEAVHKGEKPFAHFLAFIRKVDLLIHQ